ncbi:DUF2283 domain-containing protein [Candidatus Woesearchaeota archaeon]|nr:DUF2283 domain-containing protein [Candidatus Woesearchaeota archaeon]
MKGLMNVYYDEEGDFLEISIGKPTKCHAEEVQPGIFLRKDEKTNEIKSVGIVSFKKRSKDMKDIKLDLPIEVNFSSLAA